MTGSERFDHILMFLGALVPLMSALASLINHIVRQRTDAGQAVSPMLLGTGAVLNAASVNLDKAVQLGKMARGQEVPTTTFPTASEPTPAPTEPPTNVG